MGTINWQKKCEEIEQQMKDDYVSGWILRKDYHRIRYENSLLRLALHRILKLTDSYDGLDDIDRIANEVLIEVEQFRGVCDDSGISEPT